MGNGRSSLHPDIPHLIGPARSGADRKLMGKRKGTAIRSRSNKPTEFHIDAIFPNIAEQRGHFDKDGKRGRDSKVTRSYLISRKLKGNTRLVATRLDSGQMYQTLWTPLVLHNSCHPSFKIISG
ncbi:hypothetical protein PoB_001673500 [Plakobranchus ocellatus]|uniref:Uncharacterized protein n=1 Tax=Plakobranchus ocellatus TaxID=259542 RepID=A0AAV3Z477_9GAST|nr:hypothetical protein PoB_001673500 [Plakobranchus ocellatus]